MSKTTLHDVLDFIRDPNLDVHDRALIIEALNAQTRAKREQQKAQFYPGQRVSFYDKGVGRDRFARVQKINRKNIDVREENTNYPWRVSPGLLKPAPEQPVQVTIAKGALPPRS